MYYLMLEHTIREEKICFSCVMHDLLLVEPSFSCVFFTVANLKQS